MDKLKERQKDALNRAYYGMFEFAKLARDFSRAFKDSEHKYYLMKDVLDTKGTTHEQYSKSFWEIWSKVDFEGVWQQGVYAIEREILELPVELYNELLKLHDNLRVAYFVTREEYMEYFQKHEKMIYDDDSYHDAFAQKIYTEKTVNEFLTAMQNIAVKYCL